jgi:4-carboxymuconolactone decarboxylase
MKDEYAPNNALPLPQNQHPLLSSFIWQRPDGAFLGVLSGYLHAPKPSRHFIDLLISLMSIPSLPASARETAILALGAENNAKYMLYSHSRLALNQTSLTAGQIQEIKQGKKPLGLGEAESVAYDVAMELVGRMRPLREGGWERAVSVLGKEGVVALVHFVGFILIRRCF